MTLVDFLRFVKRPHLSAIRTSLNLPIDFPMYSFFVPLNFLSGDSPVFFQLQHKFEPPSIVQNVWDRELLRGMISFSFASRENSKRSQRSSYYQRSGVERWENSFAQFYKNRDTGSYFDAGKRFEGCRCRQILTKTWAHSLKNKKTYHVWSVYTWTLQIASSDRSSDMIHASSGSYETSSCYQCCLDKENPVPV